MTHPIMLRDDVHDLAEERKIAMSFPDAFEKVSHGRPAFVVSKMFAMYGGPRFFTPFMQLDRSSPL